MNGTITEVLGAYNQIRKELSTESEWKLYLYPMQQVSFSILPPRRLARNEVEDTIQAFPAAQGWICRQSGLNAFWNANTRPDPAKGGVLLSAEMVSADGNHTLHLRQDGRGSWLSTEIIEGEGDSRYLAHTVHMIGNTRFADKLSYRVYWAHTDSEGWQTCASRLLQIVPNIENNSGKEA